jgi:Las17-binding protein actin regulator
VLVAVNDQGFHALLHDKFKIGGDASAAAGPVGRDTQASTDIALKADLPTWSRTKGLFAGIDLTGASISQNTDDTTKLYSAEHSFDQILHGSVPAPPPRFKAIPANCVEIFPERPMRDPFRSVICDSIEGLYGANSVPRLQHKSQALSGGEQQREPSRTDRQLC